MGSRPPESQSKHILISRQSSDQPVVALLLLIHAEGAGVFRPLKIGLNWRGFSHGPFICPAETGHVGREAPKYPLQG